MSKGLIFIYILYSHYISYSELEKSLAVVAGTTGSQNHRQRVAVRSVVKQDAGRLALLILEVGLFFLFSIYVYIEFIDIHFKKD